MNALDLENRHVRLAIASDGTTAAFIDKATGLNHAQPDSPVCVLEIGDRVHAPSAAKCAGETVELTFGEIGVRVLLRETAKAEYLTLEVAEVHGIDAADSLTLLDIPLSLEGAPDEGFAACALALNLRTNVMEIPQPMSRLQAICYPHFGFQGAAVAIVGCPRERLREVMKAVVREAPDLPVSPFGGPFALDAAETRGSYLMDTKPSLTESTVDRWIAMAEALGVRQIDFHTGVSMRFGDYEPNPEMFPKGLASVRAVTDKLYDAGILAGLHTYAFFIAKNAPWVTPVPHPDLATAETFTLSKPVSADATRLPVAETTSEVSLETGFLIRNSVTLRIDDELVIFHNVARDAPYAFLECERGAYGTTRAAHAKGASVRRMKEMFGLFLPEPDSELFDAVVERTAHAYNEGGFRMMYLDALDGAYMLAGAENAWHYGSKFVFDLFRRLERPPLMEMSTFHHHLWYVRSRIGAWDFPKRGYKPFIDMHLIANRGVARCFLPAHVGWWGVWPWSGQDIDRMFPDDIEYLCSKALGADAGLSWIVGFDAETFGGRGRRVPQNTLRLAGLSRRYEQLRLEGGVPKAIRDQLRVPGAEFVLESDANGSRRFRRVAHLQRRVSVGNTPAEWTIENPFDDQPLSMRIEAMLSPEAYDNPEAVELLSFDASGIFTERRCAEGVAVELHAARARGAATGVLVGRSTRPERTGSWGMVGHAFDPRPNLTSRGLGLWVEGDGLGEVINLQLWSPGVFEGAIVDHYIPVDFTGRRYFEFVEPEVDRILDYEWPYAARRASWETPGANLQGTAYTAFFLPIDRTSVARLNVWYNNLPADATARCTLGPIRSLPLKHVTIRRPKVGVNGACIVFPIDLPSGHYLELSGSGECTQFDAQGNRTRSVVCEGIVPALQRGKNRLQFECEADGDLRARGNVTIICRGQLVGE